MIFEAAKKRMEERQKEKAEREKKKSERAKTKAELRKERKKLNAKLWAEARQIAGKNAPGNEVQSIFYDLRNKEKLTN